jgi:hypothetical protein
MKTNKERFGLLVVAFEKAINDRLAAIAAANGGVYQPSAPVLRAEVIKAWKEVADAESDPVDGELSANVIFAVLAINESAYSQKLVRLAEAGNLGFQVARGSKGKAKGYVDSE